MREEKSKQVVVKRRLWKRSEGGTTLRLQEINEDLGKPCHLMCSTGVNLLATEMDLETWMFVGAKKFGPAPPASRSLFKRASSPTMSGQAKM